MAYDDERKRLGREPVTIVEMDLDYCTRAYGVAPCTAAIGVTGTAKCFNTRATCQDKDNYDAEARTYRFSDHELPVGDVMSLPTVEGVSSAPTRIDPSKTLGMRASVTITFRDHPLSDIGLDKYARERAYDSATRGTFWGKLLSRNPFYNGRALRVRTGYLTTPFSWDNFETRTYVIESIEGPDSSGRVKVTAKDILKLAEDARAQAPLPSTGKLADDLTDVALSCDLLPAGIGDDEYPATGMVCIGEELMTFIRTGDTLALVRGARTTVADSHDAGATVQLCLVYEAQMVHDIVYDLLTNYSPVPAGYIDKPAWDAEADVWLNLHTLSAVVPKPTGVTTLLTELTQQGLFYIWWDERQQSIPFRAIRPVLDEEVTLLNDDDHFLGDSVATGEDPKSRITQVWTLHGMVNPVLDVDKVRNYARLSITPDFDAESDVEYGDQRIRKIPSRWIPADGDAQAAMLGTRLLYRYRNNPRTLRFQLDAKDAGIWTGDVVRITSKRVQDFTGAPLETEFQVLQAVEKKAGTVYEYELTDTFFRGRYAFITEDDAPEYPDATDAIRRVWGFICPDSGLFADGSEAYKVI